MPRPLRFILVAVLLAIPVAWWVLRAASGEPSAPGTPSAHASPSNTPSPRAPSAMAEASEDDSEALDGAEGSEEEEDLSDEEEGTGPCIAVEVTAHGAPVPGAHVSAARRDEEDPDSDSYEGLDSLELGPDGRGQAWCRPGTYLLAAQAPGFGPSFLHIEESDGGTPPLARFQLQPGHSVSGRVLDKDSQEPVAQAQISLSPMEEFSVPNADILLDASDVSSDARGAFRVDNLAAGTYRVSVEAPGHTPKETEIKVPRPGPLSLELEGTCRLEGEVVGATGAPVPGAQVWVSGRGVSGSDKLPLTDAQGRFSIEVREGTHILTAKANGQTGRCDSAVTVARGGLVDGLVIRLRPSGSISGRVFMQSTQEPVGSAFVSIRLVDSGWSEMVLADEQGLFRVQNLVPGEYSATYGSGLSQVRREGLHVEEGQELSVDIPVIRKGTVQGHVTDGLGRPAEDASISAVPLEGSPHPEAKEWASSDKQGEYSLEGLGPGRYRIEARWYSDAKPLTRELTLEEGETAHADFVFSDAPGEVQGTVQRASGGLPRLPVTVSATSTAGEDSDTNSEVMEESGHFSLKLLPGTYTLSAAYSDTDDQGPEQSVTVESGRLARVRLTVPDTVTETSGVVLNSRGEPAAGALVSFSSEEEYASAQSDAQGHFSITSSLKSAGTPGRLRAEGDGEEGETDGVRLGSSGVTVRLRKGAALRGRVVVTQGAPVEAFELQTLRRMDTSPSPAGTRPFVGDTFEFVDLPVGPLELQVRTSDGRSGKAEVQLQSGQTTNVEISVGRLGRVVGRLVTSAGEPRNGWVHLDAGTEHGRMAYASKDGRFEFIALEPGPHELPPQWGKTLPFFLREAEVLDLGDLRAEPEPDPP